MAIIQRYPADKPGDEIVSAILRTPASQIERGRNLINRNSTNMVLKTGQLPTTNFIKPTDIVELLTPESEKGRVVEFSLAGSSSSISSNITVEMVAK